jgi:hypothetical protein
VGSTASVLAIVPSADTVFEGDALEVTVETRGTDGKPATSASAVTVALGSSAATGQFEAGAGTVITSVTIAAGQTSAKVVYRDTKAGTAKLTATAASFTAAERDITVNNAVMEITISGSPVKVGGTVTVTATGKAVSTATFSIGTLVTDNAMTESTTEAGTYTGDFTPAAGVQDGAYNVVVKINKSSLT